MTNMDFNYRLFGLLALVAILGPPQSFASSDHYHGNHTYPTEYSARSVAVVPDNAQAAVCSKYTVGGTQLKTKKPRSSGTVSGRGQTASYMLTEGKTNLSFSDASLPIDFVIVRGKKGWKKSLVVHYYSSGVNDDSNIKVLGADETPLPVVEFALCAKSTETEGTPKLVTFDLTIPRCGTSGTPASPRACNNLSGEEIVLVKFTSLRRDLTIEDPNGTPAAHADPVDGRTCFCTGPVLTDVIDNLVQCDDSTYAADEDPGAGQKEPGDTCTAKIGAKVQQVTELENDPYYCRTIGGRRVCWSY